MWFSFSLYLRTPLGRTLSNFFDVSTNRATNNGLESNASGLQEPQIRIEITPVGVKSVGCETPQRLELQPVPRMLILRNAAISPPLDLTNREFQSHRFLL